MKSRVQTDEEFCYRCGKYMTAVNKHHILNGPYRNKCEKDRLYVYVCPECHMMIHSHASEMNALKQTAQRIYEAEIGARESFIERYGKSYL